MRPVFQISQWSGIGKNKWMLVYKIIEHSLYKRFIFWLIIKFILKALWWSLTCFLKNVKYFLKRDIRYFPFIFVLRNNVCLCAGTVNCRWNSFSWYFEDNLSSWLQIWQHRLSQAGEASSKISTPEQCLFNEIWLKWIYNKVWKVR